MTVIIGELVGVHRGVATRPCKAFHQEKPHHKVLEDCHGTITLHTIIVVMAFLFLHDDVMGADRDDDVSFVEQSLQKLRNYNGMVEIVAGLQMQPVWRLKKTWEV